MLPQNVGSTCSESFSSTYGREAGRALTPSRAARLAARVRSGALDRALISGADPASSSQLAARAASLTSPRFRAMIADGLERLLLVAQGSTRRWWALARRKAVRANAHELNELAAVLRGGSVLYAPGIAILGELLSDGAGPAYRGEAADLAHELHRARMALGGGGTGGSPSVATPTGDRVRIRPAGVRRLTWPARAPD
jgi:hypothetical protein